MTKKEIIDNLYNTGAITFEEAITLASVPSEEQLVTKHEELINPITEQQKSKETIINEFLKEIVDESYDEYSSDSNENLAFNSAKCVKAMNDCGWAWFYYKDHLMTIDIFKEKLRHLIKDVINNVIEKYKKNPEDEDRCFYCIETGGIRVDGWIEKWDAEKNGLVIKPMFILEENEFYLEPEKLNKLL